jgi:hypothetical protein
VRRDADETAPDDGSRDGHAAGVAAGAKVGADTEGGAEVEAGAKVGAEAESAGVGGMDVPPARIDLRSVAQLHEVQRKLQSARFSVTCIKWFLLPAMAATVAVSIGPVLRSESGGLADAVPFVLLFAVTGAVVVQSWRMVQTRVAELEFERADLAEVVGSAGGPVERRP